MYGVGVEYVEVYRLAGILKCEPTNFSFVYLGLPIVANMKLEKY